MKDLIISKDLTAAIYSDGTIDDVVNEVAKKVDAFEADVTTVKGRAVCKSFAFQVKRQKTALVDLSKDAIKYLNAAAKVIADKRDEVIIELDELSKKARLPLTEYENLEARRKEKIIDEIDEIDDLTQHILGNWKTIPIKVMEDGVKLLGKFNGNDWDEFINLATIANERGIRIHNECITRRIEWDEQESDREELAQFRKEAAEREREREVKYLAAVEVLGIPEIVTVPGLEIVESSPGVFRCVSTRRKVTVDYMVSELDFPPVAVEGLIDAICDGEVPYITADFEEGDGEC